MFRGFSPLNKKENKLDKIILVTGADGYIKMSVVTAKDMVERARTIHSCAPTAIAPPRQNTLRRIHHGKHYEGRQFFTYNKN